ncbi:signal peptidase [Kaistella yonginensis]|uniref:signal peptidase n=1 Tax=Kaistella yonginensis TaxID=658267 RepID=UPI0025B468E7|nr:signal peptidase [Kaistella yonginensis]MDN3607366.1 signal peptidase [Kaistella yonginensis]
MGVLVNAQPPCPTCPPGGGGGTGGTTPGAVASPIDMYLYILAIAAILFIVLYAKKKQQKQSV